MKKLLVFGLCVILVINGCIFNDKDEKSINPEEISIANWSVEGHAYTIFDDAITLTVILRNSSKYTITDIFLEIEVYNVNDEIIGSHQSEKSNKTITPGGSAEIASYFHLMTGVSYRDAVKFEVTPHCNYGICATYILSGKWSED